MIGQCEEFDNTTCLLCLRGTMKRLAHFIPHMTNVNISMYIHHKKHVSSLIFQGKINCGNFGSPEEEYVSPGRQDHQGQGDAHHVAGGVEIVL